MKSKTIIEQVDPRLTLPILIVDDDEQVAASLGVTLRSAGYSNVQVCCDSREVSGLLAANRYSLMLLDLNMPHVSGQEILGNSMGMQNRPPIIVVTASSYIKDYAVGAAGGVVDYLIKPLERRRLLDAVRKALVDSIPASSDRMTRNFLISDRITSGTAPRDSSVSAGILEMLEKTGREYRRLIEGLPIPYVILEEGTYRVRFNNEAFLRFLGTDSATLVEQLRFFDLLDPEIMDQTIGTLLRQGELRDVELSGRTPGNRKFVIVGSFRFSPRDGCIEAGFVDITAQKRIERELATANKLEAVGRLAAGLAHDFNNTLLVVAGYAELIESEEQVSPMVRTHAEEISKAAAKANEMIRQLLSLGKISGNARACIDLNSALRELEPSLTQQLSAGQRLTLSLEADGPLVDIRPAHLDEVVRNLTLNARDAMPRGGVITIATRSAETEPLMRGCVPVMLEIADTGTGMDRATLDRLFEPFFTTKEEGKGTGLGLSMVHGIVESVGGRIHVESAPGAGTTFRILLPRTVDQAPTREVPR